MPVQFDNPAGGGVVFDAPSGGVVFDAPSPYSAEGIAAQRQALVQSTAEVRRLRDEAEASDALPKWRVGVRAPFSDGDPLVSLPVPEELVAFGAEAVKSSPSVAAGTAAASASLPAFQRAGTAISALPVPLAQIAGRGVQFLGPVVAGGAAAIGTRLAQDEGLPEILPEGLSDLYAETGEASARNPTSAMLGQFAGAGPFFRPGLPIGTTGNARLAVPAVTGGIGAGIEGAQQIGTGEFDPQRLAVAALGSALLNRETALGRRVGPNLVMPNIDAGGVPAELDVMGRTLAEPVLPEPTAAVPEELAMMGAARGDIAAEQTAIQAAAESEAAQRRIRELGVRMMGKTPQDQLAVLDQELRLQKEVLTPAEQRAGLETKQLLKQQIEQQKAFEKAAADEQKAVADAQKAAEIAAQPPEVPKSTQILAEPTSKPPVLANVATEIATQTSPYALQENLNQLTAIPAPQPVGPVAQVSAMDANGFREWSAAQPKGFTGAAYDVGIAAIGDAPAIDALKAARKAAEEEFNAVRELARTGDMDAIDNAAALSSKVQFFSEAIGAAENTGSAAGAAEVKAAHGSAPRAVASSQKEMAPPPPLPSLAASSLDDIDAWAQSVRDYEKNIDVAILGEELAKEHRRLTRTANSSQYAAGDPRVKAAEARLLEIERTMTPEQEAIFYGTNLPEGFIGEEQARSIARAVNDIDTASTVSELAQQNSKLIQKLLRATGGAEPLGPIDSELMARASAKAKELGATPRQVIDSYFRYRSRFEGDDVYELAGTTPEQVARFLGEDAPPPAQLLEPGVVDIEATTTPEALSLPSTTESRLNNAGIDLPPISSMSREAKRAELDAAGIKTYNGKPLDEANPAQISAAVGRLRRGQLERGAIPASVIAPLGGAGVGGAIGGSLTEQEEGESDEAFQARRLRNIALGAGLGGAAGAGVNAMGASAKQAVARRSKPAPDVPLPEIGPGQGIRQTAEKVILNKSYPEQLRTVLAEDPQIIYETISQNRIRDLTVGATDQELVGLLSSPDPNVRIGALIEQGNRAAVTPGMEAEGARIFSDVAKNFTTPAQMLGMAKLVRSPEAMVRAVEQTLQGFGAGSSKTKQMSPAVRERLGKLASETIRAEQRLAKAERVARADFNDTTVAELQAAKRQVGDAKLALDKYTKDIVPETYGQIVSKIIKGNLLAPLSFAKNFFGNAAWQSTLRGSETIATALDMVYSRATGRERKMALGSPLPRTDEMKAFADGVRIASKELLTGPGSESYVKYDVQRGFHPLRAMVQVFSGLPAAERLMAAKDIASLPVGPTGKVAKSDRVKKLMEATLGISPEASFRFLSLGDKPVRSASEARLLNEQARLRGLTGTAREKFMMLPDEATQELLAKEGAEAIMAQENRLAKKAGVILDTWMVDLAESLGLKGIPALDDFNKIMGTLTVPFRPFPANFASVAINFAVPPVAFARSWVQARRGNRRESLRAVAEGVMGLMFYSAADYLWKNGLISEPADKRDRKRRSAQYETMGAQRINLSGLERLRNGEDPTYRRGDDTRDWSSLGIPAATFYVYTSRKAKDAAAASRTGDEPPTRPEIEALMDVTGAAGFAFDQSFLSGTSAFIDALQDWDNYGDRFVQNTFKAITSIPAPSTVESVAKTQYKFTPELKGDSLGETLKNVWEYKTMQLSQDERANLKRDMWGKPVLRTPEGQNPYVAQFLDVTKAETKAANPFKQSLLELYQQTNSTDVYPPLVNNRISLRGITAELTPEDHDDMQEMVGRNREILATRIASDPRFSQPNLLPEQKIMALQKAYSLGAKAGQVEFLRQPGKIAEYFPELVGQPPAQGEDSRIMSRDVKARARNRAAREQQP
jgi:hypothetical protein